MNQIIRSAKQLGATIQTARRQRNLSQQALAELVGTGQKTISHIENGKAGIKLDTLFSVTAALDLDLQLAPRNQGKKDIGDVF